MKGRRPSRHRPLNRPPPALRRRDRARWSRGRTCRDWPLRPRARSRLPTCRPGLHRRHRRLRLCRPLLPGLRLPRRRPRCCRRLRPGGHRRWNRPPVAGSLRRPRIRLRSRSRRLRWPNPLRLLSRLHLLGRLRPLLSRLRRPSPPLPLSLSKRLPSRSRHPCGPSLLRLLLRLPSRSKRRYGRRPLRLPRRWFRFRCRHRSPSPLTRSRLLSGDLRRRRPKSRPRSPSRLRYSSPHRSPSPHPSLSLSKRLLSRSLLLSKHLRGPRPRSRPRPPSRSTPSPNRPLRSRLKHRRPGPRRPQPPPARSRLLRSLPSPARSRWPPRTSGRRGKRRLLR